MNSKLLLFDIDGTLLSAHGAPKKAMATVLAKRYKNFQYDQNYDFSGRTDPQIVEHLLTHDHRNYSNDLIHEILAEFCIELRKEIINGQRPVLHPGVPELLMAFNDYDDVFLGLVTGNVSTGAKIKLESVSLHSFFEIGGFGDDSKDRNDLPPIAKKRAEEHFAIFFHPDDIWIIGDSIYDVECAHINGYRCLAVSTGKTNKERLRASNPEYLVNDLSNTERIQSILYKRSTHNTSPNLLKRKSTNYTN